MYHQTINPGYHLGKLDLDAMRHANSVGFFCRRSETHPDRLESTIRCYREVRLGPFTEQQHHDIPTDTHIADFYGDDRKYEDGGRPITSCFESRRLSPGFGTPWWDTIWGMLRIGDVLTLRWIRNNQTQTLDKHGLVRDELELEAMRKLPSGKTRDFSWNISVHVGADNTARMIRSLENEWNYTGPDPRRLGTETQNAG